MAAHKAANVTKYEAGGSGDNIVKDGYIRTVEKVWIDTYDVDGAITTEDSILIARIPKGKKITTADIWIPALGTTTSATINVGTKAPAETLASTALGSQAWANLATAATVRLPLEAAKTALVNTDDPVEVHLSFDQATTVTGGTIRSIVRYT